MKFKILLSLMTGLLIFALGGADAFLPLIKNETPVIDGELNEAVWQKAAQVSNFVELRSKGKTAATPTSCRMFTDGRTLFFGIECMEKNPEKLKKQATQRDFNVWTDDCVEIFISPNPGGTPYYQFIVTAGNVQGDARCENGSDLSWNSDWTSAVKIGTDRYTVEVAIPLAIFGKSSSNTWRFAVARENQVSGELSSWPDLKTSFHNYADFAILNGVKADDDLFKFNLTGLELIRQTEDNGIISGQLELKVNAAEDGAQDINVSLTNNKDYAFDQTRKFTMQKGANTLEIPVTLDSAGKYACTLRIGGDPPFSSELAVNASPLKTSMYFPRYRNLIFESMNLKSLQVEVEVMKKDFAGKKISLSLTNAAGEAVVQAEEILPEQHGILNLSVPELQIGKYKLTLKSEDFSHVFQLGKVTPNQDNSEIWFDEYNNLVRNGEKIFPLGFYYRAPLASKYRQYGFNAVCASGWGYFKEDHEVLRKHDILGIGANMFYHNAPEFNAPGDKFSDEVVRQAAERTSYTGPELIGWYTSDEPDLHTSNEKRVRMLIDTVREQSGYIPQLIVYNMVHGFLKSSDNLDILGLDPYLGFTRDSDEPMTSYERVSSFTDTAVKIAGNRKPVWIVLECYATGYHGGFPENARFPTIGELRLLTYLAVIHGAKGIFYWDNSVLMARNLWPALRTFAGEIQTLAPLIMAPPCDNPAKRSGNIHYVEKTLDGKIALLVANPYPVPAKIQIPVSENGSYHVAGAGRNITATDNQINDIIDKFGVNIYVNFDMNDQKFTEILKNYKREDSYIGQVFPGNHADFWSGAKVETENRNTWAFDASAIDGAYASTWWADGKAPGKITVTFPKEATVRRIRLVNHSGNIELSLGGQKPEILSKREFFIAYDDEAGRYTESDTQTAHEINIQAVEYMIKPISTDKLILSNVGGVSDIQAFSE